MHWRRRDEHRTAAGRRSPLPLAEDHLPRTPTNKVQKHLLRTEGIAGGAWDREAAGIVLDRERFAR